MLKSLFIIVTFFSAINSFAMESQSEASNAKAIIDFPLYHIKGIDPESVKSAIAADLKARPVSQDETESPRSVVLVFTDTTLRTSYGIVANYAISKAVYPGEKDKTLHFVFGGIINNVSYMIIKENLPDSLSETEKKWISHTGAWLTTGIIAGVKEYGDGKGLGTRDRDDFNATVFGGFVSTFTFMLPTGL